MEEQEKFRFRPYDIPTFSMQATPKLPEAITPFTIGNAMHPASVEL